MAKKMSVNEALACFERELKGSPRDVFPDQAKRSIRTAVRAMFEEFRKDPANLGSKGCRLGREKARLVTVLKHLKNAVGHAGEHENSRDWSSCFTKC